MSDPTIVDCAWIDSPDARLRARYARYRADWQARATNPILDVIREDDIAHDPFGTNIGALFAVCDGLTLFGYDVPSELDYSPARVARDASQWRNIGWYLIDHGYTGHIVARLLADGDIGAVIYAARVMDKFDNVCRMAGRDY